MPFLLLATDVDLHALMLDELMRDVVNYVIGAAVIYIVVALLSRVLPLRRD